MTAILKIFDIVPGWIYASTILLILIALQVQSNRLDSTKQEFANYRHEITQATLESEIRVRKKEQEYREAIDKIATSAYTKQKEYMARAANAHRSLNELRKLIADINGQPVPADAPAAPYAHAAAEARELLGTCAEEYRSVATDADQLKDQVILLQEYSSTHEPRTQ